MERPECRLRFRFAATANGYRTLMPSTLPHLAGLTRPGRTKEQPKTCDGDTGRVMWPA